MGNAARKAAKHATPGGNPVAVPEPDRRRIEAPAFASFAFFLGKAASGQDLEKAVWPKETKEDEKMNPGRPCTGTEMGAGKG